MGERALADGVGPLPLVTDFESRAADWLGVTEALARVLGAAQPLPAEELPLSACLDRALAEDVVAEATLPPWTNSAMDGYAVRAADIAGASRGAPLTLRVVERVRAGEQPARVIGAGEAARIMTGAPVPPGADTVVRVEDTDREASEGVVRVVDDRDAGQNLRPAGQDMRHGERLLARGHTVTAGTVGVLAATGRARAGVHRRPGVAVLTTGDELRDPDRFDDVRTGRGVPNSNGPMIAAMAAAAGAVPEMLGTAVDDEADLRARLDAARDADVLVTVGGASMGEADLVKRVLDQMGYRPDFWRVRMRPGSPFGFGWLPRGARRQPTFTLPGNPTSAFVTFEVFVRPFLRRLSGHQDTTRRRVICRASEPIRAPARLTYFLRVEIDGSGHALTARLTGPQGSGLVSGLARAGGLAVIGEESPGVEKGGEVEVMLISC
ncbi:MAG: gephyrin-like molybdotransferase Glp [Gemmatimonadales bacterium]